MIKVFIFFGIFFILFFLVIIWLIFYLYKRYCLPKTFNQDFSQLLPKKATYEFVTEKTVLNYRVNSTLKIPEQFKNNIQAIYLVHGTFVGEDPWHLVQLISTILPEQADNFVGKFKYAIKQGQDFFTQDTGNFTEKHIGILSKAFGENIQVINFHWSSGNHHYARVKGMIELIKQICISQAQGDRILLIGHSHASQLFALLTQLLGNPNFMEIMNKYFSDQIDKKELVAVTKKCQSLSFDFVTLGAPPRYSWALNSKMRLIHFINHRNSSDSRAFQGGSPSGVLTTRDGDYIQQWGVAGSDFFSPIEKERIINKELDYYFDSGIDRKIFRERIKLKKRLHNEGHHFLVDYGDQGRVPNFIKTIFGHGVYTKVEFLGFHLSIIGKYFYQK